MEELVNYATTRIFGVLGLGFGWLDVQWL